MRVYLTGLGLYSLLAACGGETTGPDSGGSTDTGFDGGVTSDTGVDSGVPDSGNHPAPDAGFADPATLLQGFERVEGLRMWMQIKGSMTSTMPPVLFLNSGPGHGYEYWVEPSRFLLGPGGSEDPNRLLVYADLRATGQSAFGAVGAETSSVTFDTHVLDVKNAINYANQFVGRTGPMDLIGNGYGAGVAAVFTAQNPDAVSRLILVNPYPPNVELQARFLEEIDARLSTPDNELVQEILLWNNCLNNIPRCGREYWAVVGPHWLCPANRHLFIDMGFSAFEIRTFKRYITVDLRRDQYDWMPEISTIRKPTTIIAGPCDISPTSVPAMYRDAIPGSELHVIPGTGHFPMVEDPRPFQQIVKRALLYP